MCQCYSLVAFNKKCENIAVSHIFYDKNQLVIYSPKVLSLKQAPAVGLTHLCTLARSLAPDERPKIMR